MPGYNGSSNGEVGIYHDVVEIGHIPVSEAQAFQGCGEMRSEKRALGMSCDASTGGGFPVRRM